MSQTMLIDAVLLKEWVRERLSVEAIEERLYQRGFDLESIQAHIQAYKKHCHAQKQFNGFIFLGIGAFLGFLSCVLTLLNPWPEYSSFTLYGFTGLGVTLIFIGLYCIFE
jgi:hypothetical protein